MIQLFVVLWGLYLGECLIRLRRGSLLWHAPLARGFRLRSAESLPQLASQGLGLLQPLPPLGWACVLSHWPVSLSPAGVASRPPSEAHLQGHREELARQLSYGQIQRIEYEEHRLLLNSAVFADCTDESQAQEIAAVISGLTKVDAEERGAMLEKLLERRLDAQEAASRLDRMRLHLHWLLWLENLLFLLLMILLPLSLYFLGAGLWSFWVLGATIFIWIGTVFAFGTAHRELREYNPPKRGWLLFQMICLAPAAIRGHFALTRSIFCELDPVVVLVIGSEGETRDAELRRIRRDLRWPIPPHEDEDPRVEPIVTWSRQLYLNEVESLLQRNGLALPLEGTPPGDHSPEDAAWCPRCLTSYQRAEARCQDCGGRELISFEESRSV